MKVNLSICLVLMSISLTDTLRFFKHRKPKKECLVHEGASIHYVNCTTKYQKCCEKGCCELSTSDISWSYIRIFLVCALIVFILMLVYIEMWCKKKCKVYKKSLQHKSGNCRRDDELANAQEMGILCVDNSFQHEILSNQLEDDETDSASWVSISSTPPPPYRETEDAN